MSLYSLPRGAALRYGAGDPVSRHEAAIGFPQAALLALAQALLWSLAFSLVYKAPALDGAEQFVWAFSLENGYWKHPPLPSWILHGLMEVFGPSVALSFVTTQLGVLVSSVQPGSPRQ